MSGQAVKLGPFIGGINTASDPSAVADNELVDAVNFELDLDGSLVCRPPIVETVNNFLSWTERIVFIGSATLGGVNYVIGSNSDGTWAFDGTTWTLIRVNLHASIALQFQDLLFVVAQPGSVNNGGFWDGAVWTTDANMPKGESAVFHKARLFIAPGLLQGGAAAHQLKYTDPIPIAAPTPLVWGVANVISVGQGDGQNLVEVIIYNDNLLLFKRDSTYVFAYDVQPIDAVLRKVNSKIGVTYRHCVVQYENSVFIYHEANIYEVINYDFQRVNFKVPFALDTSAPSTRAELVFLSLLGDRLIVRYFNSIYAYGLKTKTWTRWDSASVDLRNFGPLVAMPKTTIVGTPDLYYAGSSLLSVRKDFVIADGYDASTFEKNLAGTPFDIVCTVLTKNYDLSDTMHYKRLFWWGIDVVSMRDVVAIANPINAVNTVRWSQLAGMTWGSLAAVTWGSPLSSVISVETDVVDTSTIGRKFIKLLNSMRWRQINFRVTLLCNGTTAQGPARLFSLTAIVGLKQTVVKQVS